MCNDEQGTVRLIDNRQVSGEINNLVGDKNYDNFA